MSERSFRCSVKLPQAAPCYVLSWGQNDPSSFPNLPGLCPAMLVLLQHRLRRLSSERSYLCVSLCVGACGTASIGWIVSSSLVRDLWLRSTFAEYIHRSRVMPSKSLVFAPRFLRVRTLRNCCRPSTILVQSNNGVSSVCVQHHVGATQSLMQLHLDEMPS